MHLAIYKLKKFPMLVFLDFKDSFRNSVKPLLVYQPKEGGLATGFIPLPPAALLALPPLVGVTDLEMGVVGFSPSIFFAEGVLAFDEVPLLGLKSQESKL